MKCHYCGHEETKVVDSREYEEGTKRRRECLKCTKRFTTQEKAESAPLYVLKKDGCREVFDAEKLRKGLVRACEKRPVTIETINELVNKIENKIRQGDCAEVSSRFLGEEVVKTLKKTDKVAYVRFASVYREFEDVRDFKKEIQELGKTQG